jgi:hypothetical protein
MFVPPESRFFVFDQSMDYLSVSHSEMVETLCLQAKILFAIGLTTLSLLPP